MSESLKTVVGKLNDMLEGGMLGVLNRYATEVNNLQIY